MATDILSAPGDERIVSVENEGSVEFNLAVNAQRYLAKNKEWENRKQYQLPKDANSTNEYPTVGASLHGVFF